MRLYAWDHLMVSRTPAKFGGDMRRRSSGDLMILVCQVILQDHVTKGTSSNMGRTPFR